MMSWTFPVILLYWIFVREISGRQWISFTNLKGQWLGDMMFFIVVLNEPQASSWVADDLIPYFMCRYKTLRYRPSQKWNARHGLAEKAQSCVCSISHRVTSADWCKYKLRLSIQGKDTTQLRRMDFPHTRVNNAENVSTPWCHYTLWTCENSMHIM